MGGAAGSGERARAREEAGRRASRISLMKKEDMQLERLFGGGAEERFSKGQDGRLRRRGHAGQTVFKRVAWELATGITPQQ